MLFHDMMVQRFCAINFLATQDISWSYISTSMECKFFFLDNFNSWFMLTFSLFVFWLRLMFKGGVNVGGEGGVVFTSPIDLVTHLFGSITCGSSCSFTSLTGMGVGFEGMGVVSLNVDLPRSTSTMSTENGSQSMTVDQKLVLVMTTTFKLATHAKM